MLDSSGSPRLSTGSTRELASACCHWRSSSFVYCESVVAGMHMDTLNELVSLKHNDAAASSRFETHLCGPKLIRGFPPAFQKIWIGRLV